MTTKTRSEYIARQLQHHRNAQSDAAYAVEMRNAKRWQRAANVAVADLHKSIKWQNSCNRVFRLKEGDIVEQNGNYYDVVTTGRNGNKLAMSLIVDAARLAQLELQAAHDDIDFNNDVLLNVEVM